VVVHRRWFPKRDEVGVHLDSVSLNKNIEDCVINWIPTVSQTWKATYEHKFWGAHYFSI
jgi:hypothetical protein